MGDLEGIFDGFLQKFILYQGINYAVLLRVQNTVVTYGIYFLMLIVVLFAVRRIVQNQLNHNDMSRSFLMVVLRVINNTFSFVEVVLVAIIQEPIFAGTRFANSSFNITLILSLLLIFEAFRIKSRRYALVNATDRQRMVARFMSPPRIDESISFSLSKHMNSV
jgi:hypothetical protein